MEPLSMSKGRAQLHQQLRLNKWSCWVRQSVSLQQVPKADTWERFKNTASTYEISLQAPTTQELPTLRSPCIW